MIRSDWLVTLFKTTEIILKFLILKYQFDVSLLPDMKRSLFAGIRKKRNTPLKSEGIQHILKTVSIIDDRLFFIQPNH
ncbi:MAG: hypothetical protein A2W85_15875 [Bacteroidetes bacterium GWF2_41_31]|nr:MAG: hypothetical protein A2W85_15875 [Bacteroidetes bacterium GWF2_41_31]OFZ07843.1 MAG: hypothetical protein A2338_10370 [Bacteroidetes bacterium RIFOXYB12_FULL_41_6]